MNHHPCRNSVRLISLLSIGLAAGCVTAPPMPRIEYPVTYNVPVGNTSVRATSGPQDLEVNATQRVSVVPGQRLYYQVVSPVALTVSIFQNTAAGGRSLVGQMQGSSLTSSLVPTASELEFVFQAAQANSGGTAQFTLSDRPIAAATTVPR